jgi:hypothetical protein
MKQKRGEEDYFLRLDREPEMLCWVFGKSFRTAFVVICIALRNGNKS